MRVINFKEEKQLIENIKKGKSIILKCYIDFCGPCIALKPIFKEIAKENKKEELIFAEIKVDSEKMPFLIKNFFQDDKTVPKIILLKKGETEILNSKNLEKNKIIIKIKEFFH